MPGFIIQTSKSLLKKSESKWGERNITNETVLEHLKNLQRRQHFEVSEKLKLYYRPVAGCWWVVAGLKGWFCIQSITSQRQFYFYFWSFRFLLVTRVLLTFEFSYGSKMRRNLWLSSIRPISSCFNCPLFDKNPTISIYLYPSFLPAAMKLLTTLAFQAMINFLVIPICSNIFIMCRRFFNWWWIECVFLCIHPCCSSLRWMKISTPIRVI